MLESKPARAPRSRPDSYSSLATVRLLEAGLSREEARLRLSRLPPSEIARFASNPGLFLAGSGEQPPHQDDVAELGYVSLILIVGLGIVGWAAWRTTQ